MKDGKSTCLSHHMQYIVYDIGVRHHGTDCKPCIGLRVFLDAEFHCV